MSSRISSTRHAVVRGPSLTGFGNRPVRTPSHHVERLTGIGPSGARIDASRTNPVGGNAGTVCSISLFLLCFKSKPSSVRVTAATSTIRLRVPDAAGRVAPLFQSAEATPPDPRSPWQASGSFFSPMRWTSLIHHACRWIYIIVCGWASPAQVIPAIPLGGIFFVGAD